MWRCLKGLRGPENVVQWKLTPVSPTLPPTLPPSTNTTMSHWHDWYEGNCAFCSNPGHMQRIKYSSSQNLLLVNELLIQASSSHLHLPTAVTDTHTHTQIHTCPSVTRNLFPSTSLSFYYISIAASSSNPSTIFSFYFRHTLIHSSPKLICLYLFTHTRSHRV